MKGALKATRQELSALHGVSGSEQPLVAYFRKRVAGLVDDVYSPNEVVDLNDVAGAVRVLTRFVAEMDRRQDLEFL